MKIKEISGSGSGPRLLITGGVHGDEFEPMVAIRRLIDQLPSLNFSGTVVCVPVVNESAFLRGHRTAEDGKDLARTCPGDPNGTMTEQTAHELSQLIQSADFYIDLHTGGTELSVYPLTGYNLHPNAEVLSWHRRMAHAFGLPVIWGTAPTLNGRSLSVARDANVPAIYAEYEGSATCNPLGIDAYFEGCLNVMAELGMLEREIPEFNPDYLIEDPRPNSGHMQVCNPSPIEGYFDPAVQLGQKISAGEPLGTVSDYLGENSIEMVSEQTGIVLVLRTFPRVHKGETVAVILETTK